MSEVAPSPEAGRPVAAGREGMPIDALDPLDALDATDSIDVSDPGLYEHDTWRPVFARLRAEDPVHWTADGPFGPYWSVTRFDDIVRIDGNHEYFSAEPAVTIGDPPRGSRPTVEMFIAMDPPRHDARRNAVQPAVAPRNLARLEALIRERAVDILEALPVGPTFDWVSTVSIELTGRMLATVLDYPQERRHELVEWSEVFTDTEQAGSARFEAGYRRQQIRNCMATFTGLFAERSHRSPDDHPDLLTMLANGPATGDMLDRPWELLGTLMLLIVGGNDTTRNSISGGIVAINEFPGEWDKLRADPALVGSLVPEVIRWQTPVLHIRRTLKADIELGGKQLRRGDKAVMWYISGNRDDTVIADPDTFRIDRPNPRHHLSFGFGIHRCMGNRLAEMQLRVLWEEILRRYRFIEVMGPVRRVRSNLIRGIAELPVRLHPL